jgi:hypothetical protein
MRNSYIRSAEKTERKEPLGRPTQRWKVHIKTILKILCEGVGWIDFAKDRILTGSSEHGYEPSDSIKGGIFLH